MEIFVELLILYRNQNNGHAGKRETVTSQHRTQMVHFPLSLYFTVVVKDTDSCYWKEKQQSKIIHEIDYFTSFLFTAYSDT